MSNGYKKRWGVNQLTLVGHSRGGLDARNYLNSPTGNKSILQLVQIGSPNKGTPVAPPSYCVPGEAGFGELCIPESVAELSEPSMKIFNQTHVFPTNVGLTSISGHAQVADNPNRTDCDFGYNKMNGYDKASDGIVPVESARAINQGVVVDSLTPGDRTACHTHLHTDDSPGIRSALDYIKNPEGTVAVQESSRVVPEAGMRATATSSDFSYSLMLRSGQ